jgi:ABC-type dipeptide/oligopeptide/nickel transport system permease component
MNSMTLLFIAAVLAVIGSLGLGIAAMQRKGQVLHHTSAQWMTLRVAFQALAVGVLLLMLLLT